VQCRVRVVSVDLLLAKLVLKSFLFRLNRLESSLSLPVISLPSLSPREYNFVYTSLSPPLHYPGAMCLTLILCACGCR
jgi:hypothetical protein